MSSSALRGLYRVSKITSARQMSSEAVQPKGWEKIAKKRDLYQRDDGLPVHEKGGTADNILQAITWIGVLGGNIYGLSWLPTLLKM